MTKPKEITAWAIIESKVPRIEARYLHENEGCAIELRDRINHFTEPVGVQMKVIKVKIVPVTED